MLCVSFVYLQIRCVFFPTSYSVQSKTAQKSGFLNKMGQQHKAWQRRWFVLKDGVLSYYIKPRDTTPKGKVPIENVWSVQPTEDPSMPFCFEIVTLKKTILIASESKQDVSVRANLLP